MGAALKYSGLSVLSGRTTGRYRLNRGGHRQANAALYRAVIVGMRFHQPTRDYVARRTADGRTKREIIRCLNRFLAREIYQRVMTDFRTRQAVTRRCCMNTRCGWGGVARTSRDPPQEPHYGDAVEGSSQVQDEVSGGELGGLQSGPRSTRRCDGVGVLGGDRCLDARPEWPAGRAAAPTRISPSRPP